MHAVSGTSTLERAFTKTLDLALKGYQSALDAGDLNLPPTSLLLLQARLFFRKTAPAVEKRGRYNQLIKKLKQESSRHFQYLPSTS